jgi:hypothetical protein
VIDFLRTLPLLLTWVAGSQLTYTTLAGLKASNWSKNSSVQPARGGSMINTCLQQQEYHHVAKTGMHFVLFICGQ